MIAAPARIGQYRARAGAKGPARAVAGGEGSARSMSASDRDQEQRLVALLSRADPAAFETLYRRHNAAMIRVCAGIVRNQATAEDVVQETWLSVLSNIGGFTGRSSLAGWIYAILFNKARTRLRRDGRSVSFDEEGGEGGLGAAFDGDGHCGGCAPNSGTT